MLVRFIHIRQRTISLAEHIRISNLKLAGISNPIKYKSMAI